MKTHSPKYFDAEDSVHLSKMIRRAEELMDKENTTSNILEPKEKKTGSKSSYSHIKSYVQTRKMRRRKLRDNRADSERRHGKSGK